MAMKLYDLVVKKGETRDGKALWHNIGVLMETDNGGKFLLIDRVFNPAGVPQEDSMSQSCMVSCFEPKERDSGK
jgi:hypothetical protein